MKKVLVYKIELHVQPENANVAAILDALTKFGTPTIIGSSMRKVE